MTFSITARCPLTGELGIAVSTAIPAVGAINPFASARVGAIATQGWSNPHLGTDGLSLLAQGLSAAEVLERLLNADADKERRQLSIVDGHGGAARRSVDIGTSLSVNSYGTCLATPPGKSLGG